MADVHSHKQLTEHVKKPAAIAQNSPLHVVITAGGDGTIHSVAAETIYF